jgi:cytochrome c-type biogenesis protein CcsB
MYPQYWLNQAVVQVPSAVREKLKLKDFATPLELSNAEGDFKWLAEYKTAHQKLESQRNEFDKKLIKLNEKFEVIQGIFTWQYMRIIPRKNDPENKWFLPASAEVLERDSISTVLAFQYLQAVDDGAKSKNFDKADKLLEQLKKSQRELGKAVVPTEKIVNMEISYNKMNIFKNTYRMYGLVGLLMLILFFTQIFASKPKEDLKWSNYLRKFFVFVLIVFFIYHAVGLGFRWEISGHAPWSNGYEAMIFIAWVTMIAGFSFSSKNPAVLAGTAILASLIIFVSELNLLDPEITPLVPVLKSYWLMIHVAIITGSYGFLGLSFILGLFNLILYVSRNKRNGEMLTINISEITYISEMTMTVGLFMLTIGTFLGGIWANESWGRYWGWDPKETWALVSVLVYAIILHLRFIPALNGKFLFNVVSFWGYSAILFTFFGVNFMLVGLHSYAQGEGLGKFPTWLIWTIVGFTIFTIIAAIRNKQYGKLIQHVSSH